MTNKPLSLLLLLQRIEPNNPVDVMFKEGLLGRNLVVIGKTASWILEQNAFSSVFQLMGMEVEQYTVKNGRYSIILK